MAKRLAVLGLAILCVAVAVLWWAAAGLLATDMDSDCQASTAADVGFVAAYVGVGLAVVALVPAILDRARRLVLGLLGAFAVLLVGWLFVLGTCGS